MYCIFSKYSAMFSKDIIMRYIVLFCVLAIGSNVSAKDHGQISGVIASEGRQFPYQVSVKSEGLQKCLKWIIIEAYCTEPSEGEAIPQAISPGTVLTLTGRGHSSKDDEKLPHDHQSIQPDVGSEIDWHIIGGEQAEEGEFPYQVAVHIYSGFFCGGSIINNKWILTAAHCFYGEPADNPGYVLVGTNHASSGGERYDVARVYMHSNYNNVTNWNDIALLRLKKYIRFNSKVHLIELNSRDIYPGAVLTLSGWGWISFPQNVTPNALQKIKLTAMDLKECNTQWYPYPVYPSLIQDTQICTRGFRGIGGCHGDSGGPLVYQGRLAGIVSWGKQCALGLPDVFTDVSKYFRWLNNIMTSYS